MFNKEDDKVGEVIKLRVFYILANPPSPVPEGIKKDLLLGLFGLRIGIKAIQCLML